jgi:mono/diheme cytochrome c family protein
MVRWLFRVFVLLLVAGVAAVGIAAWYVQVHAPYSARAEPTKFETEVALRLRHLSIPADQRAKVSPLAATAENLHEGLEHFADHCAVCHGNNGAGDTPIGRGLYPKPPALREARTQALTDGEIFAIIQNGIRFTGMPAFGGPGGEHGEEDSWRLVQFIRHLPAQTPQEIAEMEKLNPRAPDDAAPKTAEEPPAAGAAPHTHKHVHAKKG